MQAEEPACGAPVYVLLHFQRAASEKFKNFCMQISILRRIFEIFCNFRHRQELLDTILLFVREIYREAGAP